MILGILYSLPPFKFKARPFLDLLSNAVGYGVVAFCVGWCSYGKFSKSALLYAIPYFWAVGGVFINTTIPDIEGDKKSKEITIAVFLGEKVAYFLAIGFIFVVLISGILLKDWIAQIAGGVALPLFILAGIKQRNKECFLSIRMGGAILALLVGIKFWWFLILLVGIVIGVRLYYKYKFNLTYPKLM
jgi:1,4-dihydroxy-2-naphthoate octaprenyltransferase